MPRSTQVQKQPVPKPQIHKSTMMDSVKSGFGFGMGSAIARSIVDSIFRAPDPNAKAEFVKCMESNTYEECNLFLDKI